MPEQVQFLRQMSKFLLTYDLIFININIFLSGEFGIMLSEFLTPKSPSEIHLQLIANVWSK